MAKKSKKITSKTASITLPTATATSPPATVSAPPTVGSKATATTPLGVAALSIAPPDITIPAVPPGFVAVDFKLYSGFHPKAAQITALPDAITELDNSTSYEATFTDAVPPRTTLVGNLVYAQGWTTMRIGLEAFLLYVRSNEAITWKTGLQQLEQLNMVFQAISTVNPTAVAEFPALAKLLDVQKIMGARATAARVRNAAKNAATAAAAAVSGGTAQAASTPAALTPAPGAPVVPAGSPGGGGAAR